MNEPNESGLFDAAALCDRLLRILNEVNIQGINNIARIYSVASGLETMRDALRRGENDGQDHASGREGL